MKRYILIIALIIIASSAVATERYLSIYRKDGRFNQTVLADGLTLTHALNDAAPTVTLPDRVAGLTEVPIDAIDSCVLAYMDIPVLRITLPDYPDASMLWEKELYLDAVLDIDGCGFTDSQEDISLKIKGRGNSTWHMDKKPMRLKFSKKISLCGMTKAKNYVLLNNYVDPSLMRNALAFWLARRLNVAAADDIVPCNVFINGHYAGAYTLTHKIGINSASVDIDETEGVLLELSTEFDEPYKFRSAIDNLPVMIKDPDFDELAADFPDGPTPQERLALWEADFNRTEALTARGRAAEVFDMEQAVNYITLYNIVANNEIGFPKSLYMHKRSLDADEKYILGPAWDFDVAFNFLTPDGTESTDPHSAVWFPSFIRDICDTPEFKELYAQRMHTLYHDILPDLLTFFDSYASLIRPSAKLNGLRWNFTGSNGGWFYHCSSFDAETHTADLRNWLTERIDYLTREYR